MWTIGSTWRWRWARSVGTVVLGTDHPSLASTRCSEWIASMEAELSSGARHEREGEHDEGSEMGASAAGGTGPDGRYSGSGVSGPRHPSRRDLPAPARRDSVVL